MGIKRKDMTSSASVVVNDSITSTSHGGYDIDELPTFNSSLIDTSSSLQQQQQQQRQHQLQHEGSGGEEYKGVMEEKEEEEEEEDNAADDEDNEDDENDDDDEFGEGVSVTSFVGRSQTFSGVGARSAGRYLCCLTWSVTPVIKAFTRNDGPGSASCANVTLLPLPRTVLFPSCPLPHESCSQSQWLSQRDHEKKLLQTDELSHYPLSCSYPISVASQNVIRQLHASHVALKAIKGVPAWLEHLYLQPAATTATNGVTDIAQDIHNLTTTLSHADYMYSHLHLGLFAGMFPPPPSTSSPSSSSSLTSSTSSSNTSSSPHFSSPFSSPYSLWNGLSWLSHRSSTTTLKNRRSGQFTPAEYKTLVAVVARMLFTFGVHPVTPAAATAVTVCISKHHFVNRFFYFTSSL